MNKPCEQLEKKSFIHKWAPLFVLSLGLAIIIIDTTLLNVSFSYLIRDLKTDIQSLQWVITAYALTIAALTITGGRLGDLYGRKKMFILGAILFAVGSFTASISQNVSTMIWGEAIIEGIGAAMMMPATMSLLVSTYRGRDRAIGMGMWGGVAAASSAIGPILGGYLTTNYSWRWGFRINIIVALVLIIGSLIIKECRDNEEKPTLDIFGVILSSLGLLSMVFGIIESSTYGWWKAKEAIVVFGHTLNFDGMSFVPFTLILGLIILFFFYLWEKKMAKSKNTPLINMELFKNLQFTSGVTVTSIMALGQAGLIFSIPVFFQSVRGLDAYHTGLALLPASLAAFVIAPLSAFMSHKISPKTLIQCSLFAFTAAMLLIRSELTVDATTLHLLPGMLLYGVGIGLGMAQLSNVTLSAVSVEQAGEVSGISNTLRQIGASLGSAIVGAALLTALAANLTKGIDNSTVIPDPLKPSISQAVSSQTSNVEFEGGAKLSTSIPPTVSSEIITISHRATTDSAKMALIYASFFTFLGFLATFKLPKNSNIEQNKSVAVEY